MKWLKRLANTIGDMFTSKKFLTAAAGAGVAIASGTPVGVAILAAAGTYIVGQGIADHGKEAAKVPAYNGVQGAVLRLAEVFSERYAKPEP